MGEKAMEETKQVAVLDPSWAVIHVLGP